MTLRYILILAGFLAAFCATPASAGEPRYFYCYAQDPASGTVYISDGQNVGPISERAGYGAEFSRFLSGKGKIPSGTQAYCTMHGTEAELASGIADLTQYCSGCVNPSGFQDVVWPRGGKTLTNLLAGKLAPPAPSRKPEEKRETSAPDKTASVEGQGVFVLGRIDQTDVVFTANEENGQMLTRYKADLRGGKWTTILSNDRCPGWLAIAYAGNAAERAYFVSKGGADEGEVSRQALAVAERYAARQGADWNSGVLFAFINDYRPPSGLDLSGGVIEGVKKEVRKAVTRNCGTTEPVGVGVRG